MTKATIINGRILADQVIEDLKGIISNLKSRRPPGLATVLVGHDKASTIYVANKRKRALEIGIKSFHQDLDDNCSEALLLEVIAKLNDDPAVDGILVQLPLPKHLDEQRIITFIDPNKDVDGIHPLNLGYLLCGRPHTVACTPLGVMHLIHSSGISLKGKHAVVVGRSNIVGKPMAHLLLQEDATVSICHSHTQNLADVTKQADVLVAAVGRPKLIKRHHVKPGALVVDVGINRDENNKLCGDVDFNDVVNVASYITPVPGGVGPLTIAMLLKNTVANYHKRSLK